LALGEGIAPELLRLDKFNPNSGLLDDVGVSGGRAEFLAPAVARLVLRGMEIRGTVVPRGVIEEATGVIGVVGLRTRRGDKLSLMCNLSPEPSGELGTESLRGGELLIGVAGVGGRKAS